jgi:hypothetical protein
MTQDKSREAFEAKWGTKKYLDRASDGAYCDGLTNIEWLFFRDGWQAALEAQQEDGVDEEDILSMITDSAFYSDNPEAGTLPEELPNKAPYKRIATCILNTIRPFLRAPSNLEHITPTCSKTDGNRIDEGVAKAELLVVLMRSILSITQGKKWPWSTTDLRDAIFEAIQPFLRPQHTAPAVSADAPTHEDGAQTGSTESHSASQRVTSAATPAYAWRPIEGWLIPSSGMSQIARDTFHKMMSVIKHGGQVDVVARRDGKDYRWQCDGLKRAEPFLIPPAVSKEGKK